MKRSGQPVTTAAMFVTLFAAAIVSTGVASAQPRTDFSRVEQKVTDLGHRTFWIEGAGGNTTVAVGNDGIIMVDGQFAPLHDKLKAAIAKLSDKPIKYLINTHYHGDHTGGNEPFAKNGVTVVAHANVKKRLSEGTTNGLTGNRTPPAPQAAWPAKTYNNWTNIRVAGRTARLTHPAPAHTDGDTYVYFKDANVLATGDTVTFGRYPNIEFAVGGGIDGMIAAVDVYMKLADDNTKIVPGHGPVSNKARLAEYRAMLATARGRVAKLMADGKSEHEAVAAMPFAADLDKRVGANERQSTNFVRVIYNSLKAKPAAKS
jgi:glyoxylase-like metal-dependent hydrolase (beta-lactamase superfamily II)